MDDFAIDNILAERLRAGEITPQEARIAARDLDFPSRLRVFAAASEASRAAASNRLPRIDKE